MFNGIFKKNKNLKSGKPRVICVGSSTKDIFFPISEGQIIDTPSEILSQKKIAFEVGAKYQSADRFESLGGCAANVSVGLAKLGIEVSCYTKIGNDLAGNWIKSEMQKNGVEIDLIMTEECKSDLSAIIVDSRSGERVIFSNRDANERLEIFEEMIGNADWVFISSLNGDWNANLKKIVDFCEKKSIKIAFNPGQKNIKDNARLIVEVISRSDVVMLNKDEAIEILLSTKKFYDEKDLNEEMFLLKELGGFCNGVIALTDGHRGAWIISNGKVHHAPAMISHAVDSTGAGDSFSSAFLAGYIKGFSAEECIKGGIINSSNVVKFFGAIEGLLNNREIEEGSKKIRVEELN